MTEKNFQSIDLPVSLVAPVKLTKGGSKTPCGLFFSYRADMPVGLVVAWEGETHLIHLDGPNAFRDSNIGIGTAVRGVIISDIEYRVDITSCFSAAQGSERAGALVIKDGKLYLYCLRLGDRDNDDPYEVPLGVESLNGQPEQACGFTRWSIAVRDRDEINVIRSFEAHPKEVQS